MNGNTRGAYSTLGNILAERNISVYRLHQKLAAAGSPVNIKSLYRLATAEPLEKVDLTVVGAVCRVCEVGISDLITFETPRPQVLRIDPKTQARLDELMDKNNDGNLTVGEQEEFARLAEDAHRISLENARVLVAERRRSEAKFSTKGRVAASHHLTPHSSAAV